MREAAASPDPPPRLLGAPHIAAAAEASAETPPPPPPLPLADGVDPDESTLLEARARSRSRPRDGSAPKELRRRSAPGIVSAGLQKSSSPSSASSPHISPLGSSRGAVSPATSQLRSGETQRTIEPCTTRLITGPRPPSRATTVYRSYVRTVACAMSSLSCGSGSSSKRRSRRISASAASTSEGPPPPAKAELGRFALTPGRGLRRADHASAGDGAADGVAAAAG